MIDIPNTIEVESTVKCDICKDKLAGYYNTDWYIHFCAVACYNEFVLRYNKEINDIALEIKTIEDMGEDTNAV